MVLREFPRLQFKRDIFLSMEQLYAVFNTANDYMIQELPKLQHGDHIKLIFSSKRLENILNVYLNELLELNIQTIEVIKKFFKGVASDKNGSGDEEMIKNFETFYDTELFRIEYEFEEMKKSHVFKDGKKISQRIKDFSKEFEEMQIAIEKDFDLKPKKNLHISLIASTTKDAGSTEDVVSSLPLTNLTSLPVSNLPSGKTEFSRVRSIIKKSSKSKQSIKKLLIKEGNKNLEQVIVKEEEITVEEESFFTNDVLAPVEEPVIEEPPVPRKIKKLKKLNSVKPVAKKPKIITPEPEPVVEEPEVLIEEEEDNVSKLGEDLEKLTDESPDLMTLAQQFTDAQNATANDLVQVNMSDYDSLVNNPPVQKNFRETLVNYEKLRNASQDYESHYVATSPEIKSKQEESSSPVTCEIETEKMEFLKEQAKNNDDEDDNILSDLGSDDHSSNPTVPKNLEINKIVSSELENNDKKVTPVKSGRKITEIKEFQNPFHSMTSSGAKDKFEDTEVKEFNDGIEENDDPEDLKELTRDVERTMTPMQSPPKPKRSMSKGGYQLRKRSPFVTTGTGKYSDIVKNDPYAQRYMPSISVSLQLKADKETYTRAMKNVDCNFIFQFFRIFIFFSTREDPELYHDFGHCWNLLIEQRMFLNHIQ